MKVIANLLLAWVAFGWSTSIRAGDAKPPIVDLSLLVAPEYPATWPAALFAPFHINHYLRIGRSSAYNSDVLAIDENTGTQLDGPSHSIPPPDSKLPNSGAAGAITPEKIPAWQFGGEACVIDCTSLLDSAPPGRSDLIKREHIMAWEKKHRPLRFGDVVLFHSGFSDKYYQPLPEGRRYAADPVDGKTPAWPDPDPDCMEYLATRKVMTLATDSTSMGPLPTLAAETHLAGLRHGMIWTESGTGFGKLPATGAFYCMLPVKHVGGAGGEGRAFAVVDAPLANRLIDSARNKRAVDLTVPLAEGLPVTWPGRGAGNHRQPYFRKVLLSFEQTNGVSLAQTHLLDSHTGTHLVPPSFALPPANFSNQRYAPDVRQWLAEYEAKYGPRGTSDVTTEKVPLAQTCGAARVIDVRHRAGTTNSATWPSSPEITVDDIKKSESQHGSVKAGEIVIFHTGHVDRTFKPLPRGEACLLDPLNGKSEGWPAPGPDAIVYLAGKGIRCVATDAPNLGGTNPKQALGTYWTLGTKGMVGVEFLTQVDKLPANAYFLFAPVKIRNCHGGPGRAIALY